MKFSLKAALALKFGVMLVVSVYLFRAFFSQGKGADGNPPSSQTTESPLSPLPPLHQQANAAGAGPGSTATESVTGEFKLPDIPSSRMSLSEGLRMKEQLEVLRGDVEAKIAKLAKAKASYDKARGDVEFQLKKIEEERRLLEETLQREKEAQGERLTEALEFVAKMEPRKAGPVIEGMDRDLAIHLLRKLPRRQVTKILEAVSAKKAAELMEYYTRIRSGREFEFLQRVAGCTSPEDEGKVIDGQTDSGPKTQPPAADVRPQPKTQP